MSALPRKQAFLGMILMPALCQKQTFDTYSINSSARPDRGNGTAMPSVLAVLRFRKSSTFVARGTGLVLPPPYKRTHAVRQDRRLVEIHLVRQGGHQHCDLGHVLGGHDVIVAGLLAVASLGPPAPRRERRQRGAGMDDGRDDVVLAPIHRELVRHALQAELG